MKKISAAVFLAVIFSFSATLLIFSLLASIKVTSLEDKAVRLETELQTLNDMNRELAAKYERSISIDEVERIALDELGMCRPSAEQIEYIYFDLGN